MTRAWDKVKSESPTGIEPILLSSQISKISSLKPFYTCGARGLRTIVTAYQVGYFREIKVEGVTNFFHSKENTYGSRFKSLI